MFFPGHWASKTLFDKQRNYLYKNDKPRPKTGSSCDMGPSQLKREKECIINNKEAVNFLFLCLKQDINLFLRVGSSILNTLCNNFQTREGHIFKDICVAFTH